MGWSSRFVPLFLYRKMWYPSYDYMKDRNALQHDVDKVARWSMENQLTLNVTKTYHMSYGAKVLDCLFTLNHVLIEKSVTVRDLGLTFDKDLSFKTHIQSISRRISQMAGQKILYGYQVAHNNQSYFQYIYSADHWLRLCHLESRKSGSQHTDNVGCQKNHQICLGDYIPHKIIKLYLFWKKMRDSEHWSTRTEDV